MTTEQKPGRPAPHKWAVGDRAMAFGTVYDCGAWNNPRVTFDTEFGVPIFYPAPTPEQVEAGYEVLDRSQAERAFERVCLCLMGTWDSSLKRDVEIVRTALRQHHDRRTFVAGCKLVLCRRTMRAPLHESTCVGCGIQVWLQEGETIGWCREVACLGAALDAVLQEEV